MPHSSEMSSSLRDDAIHRAAATPVLSRPATPHASELIVRIDLAAIENNVRRLRRASQAPHLLAVVKGNAYGHGLVPVATAALRAGADWLGVAQLREALALRRAGVTAPILAWLYLADPRNPLLREALDHGIDVSVGSVEQVEAVAEVARSLGRRMRIHLEFDSGLARGGARASSWAAVVAAVLAASARNLLEAVGIWTHLAWADDPAAVQNVAHVAAFHAAVAAAGDAGLRVGLVHLASSGSILTRPELHGDLVRAGLAIYGLSPVAATTAREFGLVPAMEVSAPLAAVKWVPRGTGVSYEHAYVTPRSTHLGLVPAGYADGIPRRLSGHSLIFVGGRRVPVVGRVCMDQFVVDLGAESTLVAGERVVLFGDPASGAASADEWGAAIGSHGDEIINTVAARVPRSYGNGRPGGDDADDEAF